MQIFLSDPQSFKKPPPRHDAEELKASPIDIVVHAPYLINVCSPKSNVRYGSRNILKQTCEAAAAIGAKAVIVHGGHAEDDVNEGFGRWARTLETARDERPVYIENTPGGKNAVAKRFDDLARLWDAVGKAKTDVQVGLLLRHVPRARGRRGPRRRRRARHRDHREDRPRARQRLEGRGRLRTRPPHESRARARSAPDADAAHDRGGEGAGDLRDAGLASTTCKADLAVRPRRARS